MCVWSAYVRHECSTNDTQCPRPVLVIVDIANRDTGLPTDAYFAVEEIKDVRRLG
jgi:hypothetical protein